MSIIEKLTEGIVNRDMTAEGEALLNKWSNTGLLEGLDGDVAKNNMARLLENQAKQLLKEASTMGGSDVQGFAAVAFPIVRRVFAGLIANDLVSVQPMSLPSGLIFFLDFTYGDTLGTGSATGERFGNAVTASIYGTDRVGSEITGGVNLIDSATRKDKSGPRGMVGYAYGSPTGSNGAELATATAADQVAVAQFLLDGDLTPANQKLIKFDPDMQTSGSLAVIVIDIAKDNNGFKNTSGGSTDADFDNLSAFNITDAGLTEFLNGLGNVSGVTAGESQVIRRLTSLVGSKDEGFGKSQLTSNVDAVRFVVTHTVPGDLAAEVATAAASSVAITVNEITFPVKDAADNTANSGGALNSYEMLLENSPNIPEIDIKVDSIAITAQTKKLKAKWSPELGQDLNAYHNLDAEVELTSILSEQVALEIDREILADLVNGATAAIYYWSRSPGLFVDRVTGAELGAAAAAPDFTGTVSEWYETLIETINDVSAQIHRKTLRGGANFVVCSPEVANILEFTAGFRANVTADADKGEIGAVKVGALSRKFDVIVDPYFPRNVLLVGRKGSSFLESGYVYAPYVPLQVTPTIFGVEDFVPRKGVMTRYAKKMVRPDMYGLVICRGLLGESGSSTP